MNNWSISVECERHCSCFVSLRCVCNVCMCSACALVQLERAENGSVSFLLPADQFRALPDTPSFLLRRQSQSQSPSTSTQTSTRAAFIELAPEDISALVLLRLKRSAELFLRVCTILHL